MSSTAHPEYEGLGAPPHPHPRRCAPGGMFTALRFRALAGRWLAALAVAILAVAACRSACERAVADPMEQPLRKVTPLVAFEMLRDAPYLAIVDLRPAEEFSGPLGHLNGARNLALADLREKHRDLIDLKNRTFLVYCRRDECDGEAMEFLLEHGYADAVLIAGGIEAWLADGYGTVGHSGDGAGLPGSRRSRHSSSTRHRAEAEPPPPPQR